MRFFLCWLLSLPRRQTGLVEVQDKKMIQSIESLEDTGGLDKLALRPCGWKHSSTSSLHLICLAFCLLFSAKKQILVYKKSIQL